MVLLCFRLQIRKTHQGMHDGVIFDIRVAWFDNNADHLSEDVVDMSVLLLDINEQMHPVTTLLAMTRNREIYDISWTAVVQRLNKYLETGYRDQFAFYNYPGIQTLIIFLRRNENDADDLDLIIWVRKREREQDLAIKS